MKFKTSLSLVLSLAMVACGSEDKADKSSSNDTEATTLATDLKEAQALPQQAIIKVPVSADGVLDMSKAEIRVPSQKISNTQDLAKAFEQGQAQNNVNTLVKADDLDADTSTNSWAILPWRRMVELTLFGGAAGGAPRGHWKRRHGCGSSCAVPVQPVCCQPQVVTTTTCCTTTAVTSMAPVYYNYGGSTWAYNYGGINQISQGHQYMGFQGGWL